MSLIGGLIIVVVSTINTSVLAPDFGDEIALQQAEAWEQAGMSEEQIEQTLQATAFMRTPLGGAVMGFIGTMITGLVLSLILSAFIRHKEA